MTDLIILNSLTVQPNHWSVYAATTILVGGLIAYRVYKSNQVAKSRNAANAASSVADVSDKLTDEPLPEAENETSFVEIEEETLAVPIKKCGKPRNFTKPYQGKPVSHSSFYESLDLEELVKIYRTLAYKKELTADEKRTYNIVSAILASHSVCLTRKSYAFARP